MTARNVIEFLIDFFLGLYAINTSMTGKGYKSCKRFNKKVGSSKKERFGGMNGGIL